MLDKRGKLYSYFHQIGGSNEPLIRQKQYDCFRDEKHLEYLRKWIVSQEIESQIQLFKDLVAEPRRYYNSYNKKWQVNNNQNSSMNFSLKVSDEAKERIKRAIGMIESHYQKLGSAHKLREIPTFPTYNQQQQREQEPFDPLTTFANSAEKAMRFRDAFRALRS